MRKNKLIEILQSMSGNPEIVMWNGYVGDFMPIGNIVMSHVYAHGDSDWQIANQYVEQELLSEFYTQRKRVCIVEPKARGKSSFDRLGKTFY